MFVAPARITVNPSYYAPEAIMKYSQASGAFAALAGGIPMTQLGTEDLFVYMNTLDVRTKVALGNQGYEQLPSCDVIAGYISTPTYLIRTRANWNHHDAAAAANWNVSIDAAQQHAMRQAIYQQLRGQELYGVNAANGEGLVFAQGVTAFTLPPDSNNNQTLLTYDNGQLGFVFMGVIRDLKVRAYQFGQQTHIVILGPQRILGTMEEVDIVQLVQFQRQGAGSMTTAGMMKDIAEMAGDEIEYVYDDTLIGQGAGATDLVIVTAPSLKKPGGPGVTSINTNYFAELQPGILAANVMYCDMAAPREIRSPLAGGRIDVLSELRATPGWSIRPELTTLFSIQYS